MDYYALIICKSKFTMHAIFFNTYSYNFVLKGYWRLICLCFQIYEMTSILSLKDNTISILSQIYQTFLTVSVCTINCDLLISYFN